MTREEAIKWIRTISVNYLTMPEGYTTADDVQADKKRAEALSMAIEALQAEPKHGKWGREYRKTANGVDFLVLSCSECDNADPQMNYYDFCPNCGAKMDGEEIGE